MSRRNAPHTQPQREIVLRLDAMTYGGDAIGRLAGRAIFVQGGIAGELVRAQITEDRGRFARARAVEVIEASPDRVRPRCRHFGFAPDACGGCHWQHIEYGAQLRFKTAIVREQFRRLGRIDDAPVGDTIPSPDVWAYRNHAQFSLAPDGRPGFQAAHSNHIVPIDECHVIQPPLADWLRSNLRVESRTERVDVRCSNLQSPTSNLQPPTSNLEPPTSNFHIKSASFRVSAGSFFQVNTSLIETLIDQALDRLALHGGERVLDAYCGVGLFARFIAPIARQVIGIESSPSAIADARANLAQFGHIDLREGLVENVLPSLPLPIDAAIVDPPRTGLKPAVVRALVDKKVDRLVYVSCDPATLARDARQLIDGGYTLVEVQPLDMFPHTYHIECVSQFKWNHDSIWR